MNDPYFFSLWAKWPWQPTIYKTVTSMFFRVARIFNNGDLETVAPSPKNKHPNISASFLIMDKFLFMFCSLIASHSYLDINFLLGGI